MFQQRQWDTGGFHDGRCMEGKDARASITCLVFSSQNVLLLCWVRSRRTVQCIVVTPSRVTAAGWVVSPMLFQIGRGCVLSVGVMVHRIHPTMIKQVSGAFSHMCALCRYLSALRHAGVCRGCTIVWGKKWKMAGSRARCFACHGVALLATPCEHTDKCTAARPDELSLQLVW